MDQIDKIGERIKLIRDYHGFSQEKFAKSVASNRTSIVNLEKGRSRNVKLDTLLAITMAHEVSFEWLITGHGENKYTNSSLGKVQKIHNSKNNTNVVQNVVATVVETTQYSQKQLEKNLSKEIKEERGDITQLQVVQSELSKLTQGAQTKLVPFYDIGVVNTQINALPPPKSYIAVQELQDCDLAFPVTGVHMAPKYQAGDIVLCKHINTEKPFILWGEAYFAFVDEFRLIKYIYPHAENPNLVRFVSHHPDIPDVEAAYEQIQRLYHIRGKIEVTAN